MAMLLSYPQSATRAPWITPFIGLAPFVRAIDFFDQFSYPVLHDRGEDR